MKKFVLFAAIFMLAAWLPTNAKDPQKVKVNKVLPAWHEGEYDIHFINTGRGECTWQIFPDGTTFLTDASGSLLKFGVLESDPTPAKPSDKITAGKVIVDYINHFTPKASKGHINYLMITHYHSDHFGSCTDELPMHKSGKFRMTSLAEIGTKLTIDALYDRSYPDYTYPTAKSLKNKGVKNYRNFVEWTKSEKGTVVEKWKVGAQSQVVARHNPDCGIKVRAYSGNGEYWTGNGDETFRLIPSGEELAKADKKAIPAENAFSCSFIATFGDFDFFLGGDLQHNNRQEYAYLDAEGPIAKVGHKIEVMKADHHGTLNTNSKEMLATLCPDIFVVTNWRDVQPRPVTIAAVKEINPDCDIFCTNMSAKNIPVLGKQMDNIKDLYGHIVVRVAADGKSYMVYLLDDNNQRYRVKSIYGPYQCH